MSKRGHKDPSKMSLNELLAIAAAQAPKRRKARTYAQEAYDTFKHLARKFGDPDKLTPAKRKRITRLVRYAAFASFGEWERH